MGESGRASRREQTMGRYADALLGLCATRSLADVSVTDLVEAAGTVRQTFYNYFTDINDLICFTAFRAIRPMVEPFTGMEAMRHTYEHIAANREFFLQLARQTGQNNFWDALAQWLCDRYAERYLADLPVSDERDYRAACLDLYCAGSAALFRKWCASGMKLAPETVADTQFDMLPEFVKRDLSRLPSGAQGYPR